MSRLLVLVCLSLSALAAACDGSAPAGPVAPVAPRLAAISSEQKVPFEFQLWGCSEIVSIQGVGHYLFKQSEDSIPGVGRYHVLVHHRLTGTGIGLTTGSQYRFSSVYTLGDNLDLAGSAQRVEHSSYTLRLISQDTMPELVVHATTAYVVMPDGRVVVQRWDARGECP